MIICAKCVKEQVRESSSRCECDDININDKIKGIYHCWEDREEFIEELRLKLPPFIKERISELKKKYAEKKALSIEELDTIEKRLDEIKAAYAIYQDEEIPHRIKKEKKRLLRSLLPHVIGAAIGIFISIKWLFTWIFSLLEDDSPFFFSILPIIGLLVLVFLILREPVSIFLTEKRYAESPNGLADSLTNEWLDKNGLNELESDLKDNKEEWERISGSYKRVINSAERALVGSDEELLAFYKKDEVTKKRFLMAW